MAMECKEFHPYPYQQFCIQHIIDHPAAGLFVDMGMGKTVMTLTAFNYLKYYARQIQRCLVIAPKKVAEATWRTEISGWQHLRHLRCSEVLGTATQRRAAMAVDADVYVTNRDNVQWLVKEYGKAWPFDMVVLDESSSFKNHQAKRFKALRAMRPKIKRIVELTGTPSPHGLMDLWAQVYLLDGGQRLGRTISVYRDMYFEPDKRSRSQIFTYKARRGAADAIYAAISDICISLSSDDYLTLPDRIYDEIPVKLDGPAAAAYKRLERDALLQVDESTITAGTAGVLAGKLLQLCNGAVYDEEGKVIPVHDCKLAALVELIEGLHGQHALLFYWFQHDLARILAALEPLGLRVRVYNGPDDERAWNAGEVDILLAHPVSCCYGLNLQHGGHHIIWFGLTYSAEVYLQANKRLHRQGQTHPVIIHSLVVQGGQDEDAIATVMGRVTEQNHLLESLKAKIITAKEAV